MPSPTGPIVASSKALEQYKQHLENTIRVHESIIAGIAEISDGLNGLLEILPDSEGPLNDNVSIVTEGVSKILQGFTDLQSSQVAALRQESANVAVGIQQAKIHESGIVTPTPRVRRSN